MILSKIKYILFFLLSPVICFSQEIVKLTNEVVTSKDITVGAERMDQYLPLIKGKNIAIVANHTSFVKNVNLVDTLLKSGVLVKKVFCPEHGFRGDLDAGEKVETYRDKKTGLPVISLYGSRKKPSAKDLKGIDIVIFDIQDVGVRFYTYISTMHYMMEACAENHIKMIILDRPNPNGYYVDGPVMEKEFMSFVGLHKVPLVHGLTIAEYAKMVNEEGWLKKSVKCDITYVLVDKYNHNQLYQLPIKPSPNLTTMTSVYLYPSLGLFEGTVISIGRGTDKPFQVIGHPDLKQGKYIFTPKSIQGQSKNPPYEGIECKGYDLTGFGDMYVKSVKHIYLFWLIESYKNIFDKENFFNTYFDFLVGNSKLRQQIKNGDDEKVIRASWEPQLTQFKALRKKYLLYKDFE